MSNTNLFDTLDLDSNKASMDEVFNAQPVQQPNTAPTEIATTQGSAEGAMAPESPSEDVEAYSFGEGFKHAIKHETLMGFGYKAYKEPEFEPDPDLNLNVGYFEDNFADIPREYHEFLYEGESLEEINYRAETLRQRMDDEARFNEMGTAAQIGTLLSATVLDAPAIIGSTLAGAATGGATTTLAAGRLGLTGTRIARVLGGATGVATEAAIHEAILASRDPLKNEKTVALAGLMGFGFGATGAKIIDSYATRKLKKAAEKDAKNLGDSLIREAAMELNGSKEATLSRLTSSTTEGSPVDRLYENVQVEDRALRNVGIDLTSQLKRSKDPEFKRLGEILGEDGIFGGGQTMAIDFDTTTRPILADALVGISDGYKQWAKDSGIGIAGRIGHKGRQEFNERISLMVRGVIEPETAADRTAVKATQDFFKKMLDNAKTAGVRGFENISDNIQYLTRSYNPQSFRRITDQYGTEAADIIQRTIKGAIQAGENGFDDAIAGAIAKGIYKRSMSTKLAPDEKFTTVLTNNFKEELAGILEDAGESAEKIEEILAKVSKKSDTGLDVTKSRIDMDESFVDLESGLKFTDLLENNTEQLMVRYARSVGGATSAAKFGFDTPQALINHINKTADDAFQNGTLTENQAKAMRRKATNLANQILGRPNESHGAFEQGMQLLMDYEYIRVSGGFALASMPEMLITTAENGLSAIMKHVPMGNKFISDIRKGLKPNQELLKVLESWGVGRDIDMMNAYVRIAEDDALNQSMSKTVKALNVGKRTAAMASGLPQLTRFSHILAGKSSIQKFTDMAFSNKPVKLKQSLRQLGFSNEEDLENVFNGLRKYTINQPGIISGRKVVGLDFDKWMDADPVSATRFMTAIARRVNHQIQRNLPGETPEFMSKTWGKLITQFRTFGIAAYGKKTLNAVARRDIESALGIAYTMAAASMIHAAMMYVISGTKDDPKSFLRERLSTENLVKAAIQRSGYASILPAMIDNGLSLFNQDRVFNDYARTSGLDVGGVESVPSFQTGINAGKSAGAGFDLLKGERIEEKDVRALTNMLPLRRLPGINYTFESIINEFPQRGKEE